MCVSLVNSIYWGYFVNPSGKCILNSNYWHRPSRLIVNITRLLCNNSRILRPPWKVLFFGTDDFSVESLKKLTTEQESGQLIKQLEVVTSVKPKANVVQLYAEKKRLKVHNWPPTIKREEFDVGIVVSFGHLIPEALISLFPLGMLNVHASLLPRWRGAAPIVYSLLNGDSETGVTVMQIKPYKFDIGGMLKQARFTLSPHITFPMVRDALAYLGSEILLESIKDLPHCLDKIQEQPDHGVSYAPRITPSLSIVDWNMMTSVQIYNLWRALDGIYPLTSKWHGTTVRLYNAQLVQSAVVTDTKNPFLDSVRPGYVLYHRPSKLLRVKCRDQKWISFKNVGLPGRKPMTCADFYNGYISKREKDLRYLT